MKGKFKLFLSDQFVKISLVLSTLFLLPLLMVIGLSVRNLPPLIPFYNSMPWGEDRLVFSGVVFVLPILILGVFLINILQSVFAYSKYVLVARIVMFNTFLFLLLGLLAYLQILFLIY